MERDILNFLPKYPNIYELKNDLLNPYEDNFYEAIYKKKEFYDYRLQKTEDFPSKPGQLMKHQELMARFLSSRTPYNGMLLIGEMGTGKSCSAIGIIEKIRSEGGNMKGALYLAKGEALVNNFVNELVFKCTDGRYIPDDYDKLTSLEKVHRTKKAIRDYYSTDTFEIFAKTARKLSDEQLRKRYSNLTIIIDEVHNIREKNKKEGLDVYKQLYRMLHVVEGCKILLMSGTPMKDGLAEIASVMNLILPEKEDMDGNMQPRLPIGQNFLDEFFNNVGEHQLVLKTEKEDELKEILKGRVSYLRAMKSTVETIYEGKQVGELKLFNVVKDKMSKFQSKIYKEAYRTDFDGISGNDNKDGSKATKKRSGVYANSRQASLFVFPDGSYGENGFNKYIISSKDKKKSKLPSRKGKGKAVTYRMAPSLANKIKGETHEETLVNLSKYSSKYAASIQNILNAREQGKSVFLYNEFVQGSGLILFGELLKLFGFSSASGNERKDSENARFASLTNITAASANKVKRLVNRFNMPDNMNGKIINVVMGSRKIAEGFSFQNIQIEEIHTPWFNYSETSQAIARGIRLGSHRMLTDAGIVPSVQIYQRVSIPRGTTTPSIDLYMYIISEWKDLAIKQFEQFLKIIAWDCALTYSRNHIDNKAKDGTRDCNYTDCDYVCEDIAPVMINNVDEKDIDYSTYQLYYNSTVVEEISSELVNIFRNNFSMDLESLKEYFYQYTEFELLTALRTMINESTTITNKYGFSSYIKEEKNVFFLVNSLSVSGLVSSDYYSEFPTITRQTTFNQTLGPLYVKSLPSIIEELFSVTSKKELNQIIRRLPVDVNEILIESSILARVENKKDNEFVRKLLLDYFNNYYVQIEDTWVSLGLYDKEGILRCLEDGEWDECDEKMSDLVLDKRRDEKKNIESNKYGYYGQQNNKDDKFCIRDVTKKFMDKPGKKNQWTSGKLCSSWGIPLLNKLAIIDLKMEIPDELMVKRNRDHVALFATMDKKGLVSHAMKNRYLSKDKKPKSGLFSVGELRAMDVNELRRILFISSLRGKQLCIYLRKWFDEHGLLVEDNGCGSKSKKK